MKVLKKLKDIFYDEEIVEEEVSEKEKPIIKEVKKDIESESFMDKIKKEPTEEIKIPRFDEPKKEERKEREEIFEPTHNRKEEVEKTVPERELFQSKKTFNFPILNDDEEPERKTRSNTNIMEVERKQKQMKRMEDIEPSTSNTSFKPSPVISPVYGILDKNFKKEDIMNRNKQVESRTKPTSSFAYDTVRKKAYGTIENDLENTLSTTQLEAEKILKEVDDIEKELNKLDESTPREFSTNILDEISETKKITIGEVEEHTKTIEIEPEDLTREIRVEEPSRIEKYKKNNETKKSISDVGDKTLEHDLFNLIDSMYDEEE